MNRAAKLEGNYTNQKENYTYYQEDPSVHISLEDHKEIDVSYDKSEGSQENKEVEDKEYCVDTLIALLCIDFEGIFGRT